MKSKVLGILSVLLVVFSIYSGIQTPYYPAIGDRILEFFGLKAWTLGNEHGFHLTILYALVIFVIGAFGVKKYFYKEYPKVGIRIYLVVGIIIIVLLVGTSSYAKIYKSVAKGLNSIEYFRDESQLHFSANSTFVDIVIFNEDEELAFFNNNFLEYW